MLKRRSLWNLLIRGKDILGNATNVIPNPAHGGGRLGEVWGETELHERIFARESFLIVT